ncbi:MAG TPA: hypothetical protein VL403_01430 [Candidatus Kryptonia bacterium]|nr:hypothetical protein [Candidatus Kryptonia bacterium]
MTTSDDRPDRDAGWEHIGRATEHFARRIARDAGKFAERLQEHAGEFAEDVSGDWRRARRAYRHSCRRMYREASASDVRRIFEDIRGVLSDVLEGVDELMQRVFTEPSDAKQPDGEWVRVVANRDADCSACKRAIRAGDQAFVQRTPEGTRFRCADCKASTESPTD